MISSTVVTYQIKPEASAEHIGLIEAIFAQLEADRPAGILDYQVRCLDDGISFVHVATADTSDGTNPLPTLATFQQFAEDLSSRVATQPNPTSATVIGSYYAAGG